MALPVVPVIKIALDALTWGVFYTGYDQIIAPYLEDAIQDLGLADEGNGGSGVTDFQLFEDIVKTNKALLQYHEVREDIYTPLNIDST